MDNKTISINGTPTSGSVSANRDPPHPVTHGKAIAIDPEPSATSGTVILGNPVPAIPMREQTKRGTKCCGCCCDFRRAVIILDIVLMALALMRLISLAFSGILVVVQTEGIDDDEVLDLIDASILINGIINGVGLFSLTFPLYGAMKFNVPLISVGIAWFLAAFVAGVIVDAMFLKEVGVAFPFLAWIVQGAMALCFTYPHVGLIVEIKTGIMSQETYPREEYSCCCVSPRR